jgi:hypothetical protein
MITPKEAFDAIKVLWPKVVKIVKAQEFGWSGIEEGTTYGPGGSSGAPIDWAGTTEYPIPEPKWRDAKPEDVVYPGKPARFRDATDSGWSGGVLAGCCDVLGYKWLRKSNGTLWKYCQVEDKS